MIEKRVERSDNFRVDPKVKNRSASLDDYRGSGYDRGHLAPAADFTFDEVAMDESFLLSNISPQVPNMNRGVWKKIEGIVRDWAGTYEVIHIVTGPVFEDSNTEKIGPNSITVPDKFYKIAMRYSGDNYEAIAFLVPNTQISAPISSYIAAIDEIEEITGLDFFHTLDDQVEHQAESVFNFDNWIWDTSEFSDQNFNSVSTPNSVDSQVTSDKNKSTSIQCAGYTKKGDRCKNLTKDASGFCHLHDKKEQ